MAAFQRERDGLRRKVAQKDEELRQKDEELKRLRELVFGRPEDAVTLTPAAPQPPTELTMPQLRELLQARGLKTDGNKSVLVTRAEVALAMSPVVATRATLQAASPMLQALVQDTARAELPTESTEAMRLLVCGLFSGVESLQERLTEENAVELMLLADKLEVASVAEAAAKYACKEPGLGKLQLDRMVPVWEACSRHQTAGTIWDAVRSGVAYRLNTCSCAACGAGNEDSCRLAGAGLHRLSWEQLVELVGVLPLDRAEDSAPEEFGWTVPNAASLPVKKLHLALKGGSTAATASDGAAYRFTVQVAPQDDKGRVLVMVRADSLVPMRVRTKSSIGDNKSGSGIGACAKVVRNARLSVSEHRGFSGSDLYPCRWSESLLDQEGALSGTVTLKLTKSTTRRDALLHWASGQGLAAGQTGPNWRARWHPAQAPNQDNQKVNCRLLEFLASKVPLQEASQALEAVLCHLAPKFSLAAAADFSQMPAGPMAALLRRDDIAMDSEQQVLEALQPWQANHTADELLKLLPSLRLAWIPASQLNAALQSGPLQAVRDDDGLKQQLAEALEAQVTQRAKRQREEEVPDQHLCPITREVMKDPVVASDGFTYEREAIARWLVQHNTSPKTNEQLEHKMLVPNRSVKSSIQERQEQYKAAERQVHKRARFSQEAIPHVGLDAFAT